MESQMQEGGFHPLVTQWFDEQYGSPTDVQIRSWKAIQSGMHTLIAAPTGSGKTLAALLPCVSHILQEKEGNTDAASIRQVRLLYITPLKALNNDIHHHVIGYIAQLKEKAEEQNWSWKGLSVGVRTGDTTQSSRAAMVRNPPDVLVTTPESLYLLLTSPKGRMMLKGVQWCIVDEIHDLAGDRRGLHLSVTLERLTEWIGQSPQRIGVSATQKPIELVARFLGGWELSTPTGEKKIMETAQEDASMVSAETGESYNLRPVEIIESRMDKKFTLRVTLPHKTMITKDKQETIWKPLIEHIVKLIEDSRSALIFVNNRRLCERLTLRLNDHMGYEMARSHHGSISKEQRLEVERALKEGELRCLVATSSLELGIDVGHIDLVLQIDSPKSAAAGIQRIGRAGHSVGDESRGIILARTRGQLPECAVLAQSIVNRQIEDIHIPRYALDVLCQQIAAMVAADEWELERLYHIFQRSYGYHGFTKERFRSILQVLSGFYPFVRPLIDWDRESNRLTRRSSTAMSAIMGAGTIPQGSDYPVHHAESRIHLGELDEQYIFESRVGDVFQLGTSSWRIQSIRNDRVYVVEETGNKLSEIPFWRGEGQGRSIAFSAEIGHFLEQLDIRIDRENKLQTLDWLMDSYYLDASAAEELLMLLHSQKAVSVLPTHRRIVIEQFQDEYKQHRLIIHSWFGRKFNRTWQLAIQAHAERSIPYRIYASAKDNGIEFVISDGGSGEALRLLPLIREVTSNRLETLLQQAIPASPQFGIAFRRLAETSLLLSRSFNRMPSWQKRLRSEELLRESLPYAETFPFIEEAIRICLHEDLDVGHVREVLEQIESGQVEVIERQSAFPSPFTALFLSDALNTQIYESDAISRDLQANLAGMDRALAGQWFSNASSHMAESMNMSEHDDKRHTENNKDEEKPRLYESGELLSLLKHRGEMTETELLDWLDKDRLEDLLHRLYQEKKIVQIQLDSTSSQLYWICADEADTYSQLGKDWLADRFIATRYVNQRIRITSQEIQARYGLKEQRINELVHSWESENRIELSQTDQAATDRVLLNRQLDARHNRQQAVELRKATESIHAINYCIKMMSLQHVLPHTRLNGEVGLRQVIEKLQGLYFPLSQWESSILPLRLNDYKKEMLDRLCSSGEVIWLGQKQDGEKEGRIAFFLAESKELYYPMLEKEEKIDLNFEKELLQLLQRKGASFLTALSRETGHIPSELTVELLNLSWKGLVSNDQFAPLRLNGGTTSKTAKGKGFQSGLGRWYPVSSLKDEEGCDQQICVLAWIKHLLNGYGLLTKDIADLHLPWEWSDVYAALKQLETWGMLTRGLWVENIHTLQFAGKDQIESLRSREWAGDTSPIVLPSTDPANPFGLTVHWPEKEGMSFTRKKGNDLVIQGGRWLLWIENNGKRMCPMEKVSDDELYHLIRSAAEGYLRLPKTRKLIIEKWNGLPVLQTEVAEVLYTLGAEKDRESLVIWPSALR
ncbi:DEAD/DEAH box helicase [Paenibacillus sp. UNC451MF]|uniref:DEAD/DEAH box helicase n=1 Tax=Paenibacillus sp. UNC451MF TaxID=1449063 RepID=UPI00048A6B18|nr:DEAD/DEAH box helicase [Paenibacillus sp. UNC451MF]